MDFNYKNGSMRVADRMDKRNSKVGWVGEHRRFSILAVEHSKCNPWTSCHVDSSESITLIVIQ